MSKVTVLENVGIGTELAKRFSLDGVIIEKVCDCGEVLKCNLGDNYLSYPEVGRPQNIYFYCEGCESEYEDTTVEVQISLVITEE